MRRPGRFTWPDLGGALAVFDRCLLGLSIALLRGSNQRGINNLATHGEIAALLQFPAEGPEQPLQRTGLDQRRSEYLEVDDPDQPFQWITVHRQPLQVIQ
ncbi:MAG: hypothetical protein O9272_02060 [Brevundimonas sp.]|nr:hypothetical protein [Brevundimonas sp.]